MSGIVSLLWRFINWLASHGKNHEHKFELKYTPEDLWAECECGVQRDIPDELVQEAIAQLQKREFEWRH